MDFLKHILLVTLITYSLFGAEKFLKIKGIDNFEPSGLFIYEGKFLTVNDNDDSKIYQLVESGDFLLAQVFKSPQITFKIKALKKKKFDLEGLTYCNGKIYVVDERDRYVFSFDPKKVTDFYTHVEIKDKEFKKNNNFFSLKDENASFEGIACNDSDKKLFIINERSSRRVFEFDLMKLVETFNFDTPSGTRLPLFNKDGKEIGPDYSDAYFYKNYLYLLYRNDHKIQKVDIKTHSLVSEFSFSNFTKTIYQDENFPFGLAEGLSIDDNFIYLVIDNNGIKLKDGSNNSGMVKIDRPKDF